MHTAIYYFSGTGNSLRAARVIGAALGGARLISMRSDPEQAVVPGAERIGFVCPVYEWDIPKRAKAFVQEFSVDPGAFCFMAATYAAIHGRCFETADGLLRQKGTRRRKGAARPRHVAADESVLSQTDGSLSQRSAGL